LKCRAERSIKILIIWDRVDTVHSAAPRIQGFPSVIWSAAQCGFGYIAMAEPQWLKLPEIVDPIVEFTSPMGTFSEIRSLQISGSESRMRKKPLVEF
jgi:hypothetical protein